MSENNGSQTIGDLPKDQKGISNTTVAVLVVLALIMTVIGTWAVLSNMNEMSEASTTTGGTNIGQVSFTIIPAEPPKQTDEGLVTLDVN